VNVSNGVELLSNGLRALERLPSLAPDRAPTFPFLDQGKGQGYMREKERKKEKKKEKKQGRREP
jgi:hypothetical protein